MQVSAPSNAQQAGIRTGDVLLALNGETIESVEGFVDRLQSFEVGDTTRIQLLRGGETLNVEVVLNAADPQKK